MKGSLVRWKMRIFVFLAMITTLKVMSRILTELKTEFKYSTSEFGASRFCWNLGILNFDLSSRIIVILETFYSKCSHTPTVASMKASQDMRHDFDNDLDKDSQSAISD